MFLCLQQSVPKDTETCFGITDYDETCCKRYFVEVFQKQEKLQFLPFNLKIPGKTTWCLQSTTET